MRQKFDKDEERQKTMVVWSEFVVDLWKNHLPHLRELEELYGDALLLLYDPSTSKFGFEEGELEQDEHNWIGCSSDLVT